MTPWKTSWKRLVLRIKIRIVSNAQRYLTLIKCLSSLKKKRNRKNWRRRKRSWRSRVSPVSRRRILLRRATKITVKIINSLLNNIPLAIRTFLSKVLIIPITSTRIPTVGGIHIPIRPSLIITCCFSINNTQQLRPKSFPRRDQDLKSPNKNSPSNNNIKIPITRSRCIINKTCSSHSSPTITDNTREANPKFTHPSSRHRRTRSSMRQRDGGNDSILINCRHLVL